MSVQEITLSLPEALYDQIKQVAERLRKPIEVVLAEAVAADHRAQYVGREGVLAEIDRPLFDGPADAQWVLVTGSSRQP